MEILQTDLWLLLWKYVLDHESCVMYTGKLVLVQKKADLEVGRSFYWGIFISICNSEELTNPISMEEVHLTI